MWHSYDLFALNLCWVAKLKKFHKTKSSSCQIHRCSVCPLTVSVDDNFSFDWHIASSHVVALSSLSGDAWRHHWLRLGTSLISKMAKFYMIISKHSRVAKHIKLGIHDLLSHDAVMCSSSVCKAVIVQIHTWRHQTFILLCSVLSTLQHSL